MDDVVSKVFPGPTASAASLAPPPAAGAVAFNLALPSSTWLHRCANPSVDCVSGSEAASGAKCAINTTSQEGQLR